MPYFDVHDCCQSRSSNMQDLPIKDHLDQIAMAILADCRKLFSYNSQMISQEVIHRK